MKILAAACVVTWLVGGLLVSAADKPGDDFGSGFLAVFVLGLAVVETAALVVWAAVRWWLA